MKSVDLSEEIHKVYQYNKQGSNKEISELCIYHSSDEEIQKEESSEKEPRTNVAFATLVQNYAYMPM